MIPEAPLEDGGHGLVPRGEGWFVVNTREARWWHAPNRGAMCFYEGDVGFPQLGINVSVLEPGQVMSLYHWEADQEDFLVVSGEALLLVEGDERPLRAWDFVHCPPGTKHTLVGAGSGPCVIVSVGARVLSITDDWGAYVPDEASARHGASVAEESTDPDTAYDGDRRARARTLRRLAARIAVDERRLDLVGDDRRIALALAEVAPLPVLEIGVAAGEPLRHRDAVDLLLEPFGKLPLHVTDAHDGRDLLPVRGLGRAARESEVNPTRQHRVVPFAGQGTTACSLT